MGIQQLGASALALGMLALAPAAFAEKKTVLSQDAADVVEIENTMFAAGYAHDNGDEATFAAFFTSDGMMHIFDPKAPIILKAAEISTFFSRRPLPPSGAAGAGAPGPGAAPQDSGPAPVAGGPAVDADVGNAENSIVQMHHVMTNFWVKVDPSRTKAKLHGYYVLLAHQPSGGDITVRQFGGYDNDFVKVDGKWKIQNYNVIFGPVKAE